MQKTHFTPFFLIFLFLLAGSALATEQAYLHPCTNQCYADKGRFDSTLLSYVASSRSASQTFNPPLVADVDNDGTPEIFGFSGSTINAYHGNSLTPWQAFNSFPAGSTYFSNALLFDINKDGKKEVIVAQENNLSIWVIAFNNTGVYTLKIIPLNYGTPPTGEAVGQVQIGCGNISTTVQCMAIYQEKDDCTIPWQTAMSFNYTQKSGRKIFDNIAGYCVLPPSIKGVEVGNFDGDSNLEFVAATMEWVNTAPTYYPATAIVNIMSINATFGPVLDEMISETDAGGSTLVTGGYMRRAPSNFITPASVYPYGGGASMTQAEIVIGYAVNSDEWEMKRYSLTGSEQDDYPEVEYADGSIISNIARGHFFEDSIGADFCVLGMTDNLLDATCGSATGGDTLQTYEYSVNVAQMPGLWNASVVHGTHVLIHAADMDNDHVDEIVSQYGVLKLNRSSCNLIGDCELYLLWAMPSGLNGRNNTVVPVDPFDYGFDDLIIANPTNLWYIDDAYTNTAPTLGSITVNPCSSRAWNISTDVTAQFSISDVDNDLVRARLTFYYGSPNAYSTAWTTPLASNSVFNIAGTVNKTIASAILRVEAMDSSNATDTEDISYSVSMNGIQYGDCSNVITPVTPTTNATNTSATNPDLGASDEQVASAQETISLGGTVPLIVGGLITVVICMLATALLMNRHSHAGDTATLGVSLTVGFIVWIMLTALKVLPGWTIVLGIVFACAGFSFRIYQKSQGG